MIFKKFRRFFGALRYGFFFSGSQGLEPPGRILFNWRFVRIQIPQDEPSVQAFVEIFLDNTYNITNVMCGEKPSCTIVDVGANSGLFSSYMRTRFDHANIYAFEPSDVMITYLKENAKLFKFNFFPLAVGSIDAKVKMVEDEKSHLFAKAVADPFGTHTCVSFNSVLDMVGGHIDVLKLDCEGAEWDIFDSDVDWKKIHYITMEYHEFGKEHCVTELLRRIDCLGFEVKKILKLDGYGMILLQHPEFGG